MHSSEIEAQNPRVLSFQYSMHYTTIGVVILSMLIVFLFTSDFLCFDVL